MGRTLVMGDIHGAHKAVIQCLERSKFDKNTDTLVQLGDVADGWSETREVVDELLNIPNLIPIKGNHDEWAYEWMRTGIQDDHHRKQGGQATFDSYLNHQYIIDIPESHIRFFSHQIDYYIDDKLRIFTHGGFNRHYLLRDQLTEMFCWDRDLWMAALSYKELEPMGAKFRIAEPCTEVYIGHTATTAWKTDKPMKSANIWNLDTGAGFHGKLTIMDADTHEYWQSDLVQQIYPDELGRRQFK